MAEIRTLKAPPIVEAVFQLDVTPRNGLRVEREVLEGLPFEGEWKNKASFRSEFKLDTEKKEFGSPPSVEHTHEGYVLFCPDVKRPKEVVDFEFKRFSYHRLPRYDDFDQSIARLEDYWAAYREHFQPKEVVGVSLRFLNSIVIPSSQFDFGRYFTAPLPIGPEWGKLVQGTTGMRTHINVDLGASTTATVISMLRQAVQPGTVEMFLDIKVGKFKSFGAPDNPEILMAFADLRVLKNQLFFGSVTENAVTLFEENE